MDFGLPPGSVIGLGPPQEQHNLGSKAKEDPEGANNWRLSTNHTPHSWAMGSFSIGILSCVFPCPSQQVNSKSETQTQLI